MTIKRLVLVIFTSMLVFSISLAVLMLAMHENQKNLLDSHDARYQSYLLADQLRHSSDDLTRFSRTYALTGDTRYRDHYFEVLAIRSGEKPRPKNYERIYWDLIVGDQFRPRSQGENESLDSLMQKAGFSSAEFDKLMQTENLSNTLVATEITAMNAVREFHQNSGGQRDGSAQSDLTTAQNMLYDKAYHLEKKRIMQPVDDFFVLLDQRTLQSVEKYSTESEVLFDLLIVMTVLLLVFSIILSRALVQLVLKPLGEEPETMSMIANRISHGDLEFEFDKNKSSGVYSALETMNSNLKKNRQESLNRAWLTEGEVSIGTVLRNESSLKAVSNSLMTVLCRYINAQVGALYYWHDGALDNGEGMLRRIATFSHLLADQRNVQYKLGQGLVGQAATEATLTIIERVPDGYMEIDSACGHSSAQTIVLMPFFHRGELRGLIELAFLEPFTEIEKILLEKIADSIGIAFENITAKANLNITLKDSQNLSEELQAQQEELRVTNEALIEKSDDLERQTLTLEQSQKELQDKASQLEISSQYKSEFLANMSHELRTPLNSLLILSHLLADNKEGNLSEEQVESAQIIRQSGNSLLELINNILDLSKIESGHLHAHDEPVYTIELKKILEDRFSHMAKDKGIAFSFDLLGDVPELFVSDITRLEQVLNNLTANALKFTKQGSVNLSMSRIESSGGSTLHFSVQDTGIGIAHDKQESIFNAFQQADGSTTRQFGGTGLGLAISRKLATLLGGHISLESQLNSGSTFTLVIPERLAAEDFPAAAPASSDIPSHEVRSPPKRLLFVGGGDDVAESGALETLLNVENISMDVVHSGNEAISSVARQSYAAVILELGLPDISGFEVLRLLAEDSRIVLPPVIIYTDQELNDNEFLELNNYTDKIVVKSTSNSEERLIEEINLFVHQGAISSELQQSSSDSLNDSSVAAENLILSDKLKGRSVLLVDDDMRSTFALAKMLRFHGMVVHVAPSGAKALSLLDENEGIELVLMDIMMPNMDGYETIQHIRKMPTLRTLPIIALTANALPVDKEKCLNAGADDYLSKPINPQNLLTSMQIWL